RVLDLDAAAFDRCLEIPGPVGGALQYAGEQADQLLPADRAAAIEPRAVAFDQERQVAAVHLTRARPAGLAAGREGDRLSAVLRHGACVSHAHGIGPA